MKSKHYDGFLDGILNTAKRDTVKKEESPCLKGLSVAGELRKAEWSEINRDKAEWSIPAYKMRQQFYLHSIIFLYPIAPRRATAYNFHDGPFQGCDQKTSFTCQYKLFHKSLDPMPVFLRTLVSAI